MANPHEHAGSEQSSLPLSFAFSKLRHHAFSRARQYSTARQSRGPLGTPTSGRHRPPPGGRTTYANRRDVPAPAPTAPAEVPVAVRTTPLFKVRLVRCAARSGADQRSAFPCLRVALHGGVRPRLAPSVTPAANRVRCHCFLRAQQYATDAQNRGDRLERRPPVGTARRRRANHVLPTGGMSRTCTTAPAEVPVAYGPPRCSRSVSFAALRAAVPTRGRRSLACASPCQTEVGDRAALSSRAGCAGGPIMRVSPGGDSSLARLVSRAPRRSRRSRHFAHRLLVSASTQSPARARTPGAPPRRPPAASRRSPGASR